MASKVEEQLKEPEVKPKEPIEAKQIPKQIQEKIDKLGIAKLEFKQKPIIKEVRIEPEL